MKLLSKDESLFLLNEYCSNSVLKHSIAVSNNAKKIAEKIRDNGYDVDVNFVETAALLHDIGRSKTHGVMHGIEGAKIILRSVGDKKIARVCETHIGAGILKDEAEELGLPRKNYLPETLEEKIIAHADNLTFGTEIVSIEEVLKKLGEKLGKKHHAIKRILELNDFIEELLHKKQETQETKILESFKKEMMEVDALNKIKWDSHLNPDDFSILYLDRTAGKLKQINFNDIQIEGDFMKIGDSMIPMHRIRKIKYKDEVAWNRRRI